MLIADYCDIKKRINLLRDYIDYRGSLELLAEESSELTQAAMKLIRVSEADGNLIYPVNKEKYDIEKCQTNLIDELTDVLTCVFLLFDDRARGFTIAMHKDFKDITDYFIITNVKPCPEFEMFFRCIKTYSSNINPEVIERTYILEGIRPKPSTIKCGDQTFKFVGNIVDEGFDAPNSCASTPDPVNHPNHYEMVGPFESFDIIVESLGIDGARQFCQGNIIKYQTRYREKNGEEDLKKRHWYSRMDQMLAKCETVEDYYKLKESDF